MTKQRKILIKSLNELGGSLVAGDGRRLSRAEVKEKLHLDAASPTTFLAAAEKEGIITRDVDANSRATKGIYLTDEYRSNDDTHGNGKSDHPKVHRASRSALKPFPMPDISTKVEIGMAAVDRDGRLHVGFRNDEGSWVATIDSFEAVQLAE